MIGVTRKFLVKEIPALESLEYQTYKEGYFSFCPFTYIEQCDQDYALVMETSLYQNRVPLTEQEFYQYVPHIQNHIIEKKRVLVSCHTDETIYMDIYQSQLMGLVTIEVEFINKEKAELFVIPNWFGKEITYDTRYQKQSLSSMTKETVQKLQLSGAEMWYTRLQQISKLLSCIKTYTKVKEIKEKS